MKKAIFKLVKLPHISIRPMQKSNKREANIVRIRKPSSIKFTQNFHRFIALDGALAYISGQARNSTRQSIPFAFLSFTRAILRSIIFSRVTGKIWSYLSRSSSRVSEARKSRHGSFKRVNVCQG